MSEVAVAERDIAQVAPEFSTGSPSSRELLKPSHKILYLDIEDPTVPVSFHDIRDCIEADTNPIKDQDIHTINFDVIDAVHTKIPYYEYQKKWNEAQREGKKLGEFFDENPLLPTGRNMPDTIVIGVPQLTNGLRPRTIIDRNREIYYQLLYETVNNLPPEKRPRVIFYTDGFEPPLDVRSDFQSFFFCSSPEELRQNIELSKQMKNLGDGHHFKPETLEPMQEESYNTSTDLREWETETADTYESLKHIHGWLTHLNTLYENTMKKRYSSLLATGLEGLSPYEKHVLPVRPMETILDLGTGEGRIAGMLARVGYNVLGLDISPEMLKRAHERIFEEGKGLRGEIESTQLSYPAMQRLVQEGEIKEDDIRDDEETAAHYITAQGSFFNLHRDLNNLVLDWEKKFPDINKYRFFNTAKSNPYVFANKEDQFLDAGFDAAIITWHTFCEVGDPINQKEVLRQIQNVLWPGGELMIEIPDRDEEPYKSVVEAYHKKNPDAPYGTVRDAKPDGGEYPPRFFPSKDEIIQMLKASGLDVDPEKDMSPYTIEGAKGKNEIKELFITARKSNMRGDLV